MKKMVRIGFRSGHTMDTPGDFNSFAKQLDLAKNSHSQLVVENEFMIDPEQVDYVLAATQQEAGEVFTKDQVEKILEAREREARNLREFFEDMEDGESVEAEELIEATNKPDYTEVLSEPVTTGAEDEGDYETEEESLDDGGPEEIDLNKVEVK